MLSSDQNILHLTVIALNNFIQHSHCHIVLLFRLTSLLKNALATAISSGVASPIFFGGAKCLTLGEQQYFCLGRRFSKHEMTKYAKNLGVGPCPPAMPMIISPLRQSFRLRFLPQIHQDESNTFSMLYFFI